MLVDESMYLNPKQRYTIAMGIFPILLFINSGYNYVCGRFNEADIVVFVSVSLSSFVIWLMTI